MRASLSIRLTPPSRSSLLATLLLFTTIASVAPPSKAEVVRWVSHADGDWNLPQNWSSSPNLPGPDDDVVLNVEGLSHPQITHSSGRTSVRTLDNHESLRVSGGTIETMGPSTSAGDLEIVTGGLVAQGPTASFHSSGAVTLTDASLMAVDGAKLVLPGATSYSAVALSSPNVRPRVLSASGAESQIVLANLSSLGIGVDTRLTPTFVELKADNGGLIDLSEMESVTWNNDGGRASSRTVVARAHGVGSRIDLSSLTDIRPAFFGDTLRLESSAGGIVHAPHLASAVNTTLSVDGANTHVDLTSLNSISQSTLTLSNASTADLANLTSVDRSDLIVMGGSSIQLPQVTEWTGFGNKRSFRASGDGSVLDASNITRIGMLDNRKPFANLDVEAIDGGVVDLSNTLTIIESGGGRVGVPRGPNVLADGEGSVVDLRSLSRFENHWITPDSKIQARNGGTVRLNPFAVRLQAVDVIVDPTGTIDAQFFELGSSAAIKGTGTLAARVNNVAGLATPGPRNDSASGVLVIDGDYSQGSGATLVIDDMQDRLVVGGVADLDGTFELTSLADLKLGSNVLTILSGDRVSGRFISFPERNDFMGAGHLGDGQFFAGLNYNDSSVTATIFQSGPGDVNGDGTVGFGDFVRLANNFGGSANWTGGDFTGDGKVQFEDFTLLATAFGTETTTTANVPEPVTRHLMHLLSAFLVFWIRSRSPQRSQKVGLTELGCSPVQQK